MSIFLSSYTGIKWSFFEIITAAFQSLLISRMVRALSVSPIVRSHLAPMGAEWTITYEHSATKLERTNTPASRSVCAVRWFLAIMDSGSVEEALRVPPSDPFATRQRVYDL